ncbi:hypothetical protein CLV49_2135 [Labedella gwakjiensis]|uniref:Uncharacterized protein n=1 Tax=Labedella gwakjiensis TaxID=390269 RepID=A0A2P8GX20_9MICO|nr:hypothetical protein [Labedella gwakjiensis]PSL38510.1 hypothetical protein CLV49_2135 [Labedella gwakjiensis]
MTRPILDHVRSFFPDGVITQPVGDVDGITLHLIISTSPAVNLVFTDGLAARVEALVPQEIAVFALPGQWRQAAELVSATAVNLLERGSGLNLGDIIASPTPIVEGTAIGGVLASTNPFLDDGFDVEPDEDGGYSRQIVTLFPLTVPEAAELRGRSDDDAVEEFLERLDAAGIDETDLTRPAAGDAGPSAVGDELPPVAPDIDRLTAVATGYFALLAPNAELRTIPLENGAGICVVHTVRGGGKIYVAPDESVLFVGSALDFDAGLAAFLAGTRTPPEKFVRPTS